MPQRVCPVWIGYLLLSPLRRALQNPDKILGTHIREGMTALDFGSAMGFFSLPMARKVGPTGKVFCVDLQEKMLDKLRGRASKAGLSNQIVTLQTEKADWDLGPHSGTVDFALAMAVIHEVPDARAIFASIFKAMKPGAEFLLAEPRGHVDDKAFELTVEKAVDAGFRVTGRPIVARSRAALFYKP